MMSKRWFLTLIMTGVVATLITVLGAWSSPTAAQASDQDLGGSWIFTVTPEGMPPVTDLITFTTDGAMMASLNDPTLTHASTGHGAWVANGDGSVGFTFMRFVNIPGPEGNFTATVKVRGTITLNETSDELSGPFEFDVFDPSGNKLFTAGGTFEATRIGVEPLQ